MVALAGVVPSRRCYLAVEYIDRFIQSAVDGRASLSVSNGLCVSVDLRPTP